jgi:hypothetical protein
MSGALCSARGIASSTRDSLRVVSHKPDNNPPINGALGLCRAHEQEAPAGVKKAWEVGCRFDDPSAQERRDLNLALKQVEVKGFVTLERSQRLLEERRADDDRAEDRAGCYSESYRLVPVV